MVWGGRTLGSKGYRFWIASKPPRPRVAPNSILNQASRIVAVTVAAVTGRSIVGAAASVITIPCDQIYCTVYACDVCFLSLGLFSVELRSPLPGVAVLQQFSLVTSSTVRTGIGATHNKRRTNDIVT